MYYNELYVDPNDPDRLYAVDTFLRVSEDGGASFKRMGLENRHVDDHALWIDPSNTNHLLVGGDGGIYETYDRGKTWRHADNLPIVQFYRVAADNDLPFYNVCGGTQDNNSLCGPSQTTDESGITNADWDIILTGDGYEPQSDPTNPDIIYTQYQYGGLARYDRTTGEAVYIAPHAGPGENKYRFNWNSPLIISPHNPKRLYYGAEKVFRSDDQGSSWTVISPDLSRGVDRNKLEVMGRVWGVDSVGKNQSTSFYGSLIIINESTKQEGLIYAGTDDGLIHVTDNGGKSWRKISKLPGVPNMTYISDIESSWHDTTTVFATADNHKKGDFTPYVLKSSDRGKTWTSIAGNLPQRGPVHTIVQDHVDPALLFVGTEFGVFFTQNGGKTWSQLKAGLPTISVRDLEIQRRESDLIVGTFGRGIYVLDDYSPMRTKVAQLKSGAVTLFAPKDALLYVPRARYGGGPKGSRGAQFWQTKNPQFGATFTYYLKDGLSTKKARRREAEAKLRKAKKDVAYPSWSDLRKEDREATPSIIFTVRDSKGAVVRRMTGPTTKGLHRVAWDLRYPTSTPINLKPPGFKPPWYQPPRGPLVTPGAYTVTLSQRIDGVTKDLTKPMAFNVKALDQQSPLVTKDRPALLSFQQKTADLQRAVNGASKAIGELTNRIKHLQVGIDRTPNASFALAHRLRVVQGQLEDLKEKMLGDRTIARRNEPVPMSIVERVNTIVWQSWGTQQPTTGTHRRSYDVAAKQFAAALDTLRRIELYVTGIETELEQAGGGWTPGRLPTWKPPSTK